MAKTALVIGAGLGGLATALRLACKGYSVTVLEKNEQAGGRLNQLQKDGFTFDMGPSFFSMSYEFEELFKYCGIKNPLFFQELDPLYADLYDHVLRVSEWTESLRDMVTTVFETNLSLQDARLNQVMKKLTGWAAIIAVPTAITGFYGQNVLYPGVETFGGFVTSTTLIVIIGIVLYWTFKRRDWL